MRDASYSRSRRHPADKMSFIYIHTLYRPSILVLFAGRSAVFLRCWPFSVEVRENHDAGEISPHSFKHPRLKWMKTEGQAARVSFVFSWARAGVKALSKWACLWWTGRDEKCEVWHHHHHHHQPPCSARAERESALRDSLIKIITCEPHLFRHRTCANTHTQNRHPGASIYIIKTF